GRMVQRARRAQGQVRDAGAGTPASRRTDRTRTHETSALRRAGGSMSRKWLRLDAQWDDTEWVMMLGPLSQLAWIKLLCYVKRDGRAGEVYALTPKAAAKKWDLPVPAVEAMLRAAEKDGALRVGG